MSPRVAYLTGEYPRATDTFVQREVEELRELGMTVETFAIRRPAHGERVGEEQAREESTTSYVLPAGILDVLLSQLGSLILRAPTWFATLALAIRTRPLGLRAFLYQLFYFVEAVVLARRLRRRGIEHLHNHFANSSCTVAMLAARLAGITFSFTIHGPAIFFEPRRWRIDEKARRALFVSCISHFCRSQTMIFAPPERWERLHIVHCGVNPDELKPRAHEGEARRILFVGRLAAVKGLEVLLRAFADMEAGNLELDLVGDGPDRAALERLAVDLGIADRVVFHGYRSRDQVAAHLAESDLFVMSSFAEGVPVVLMEAMSAGLPVIATRVAGVSELVKEGVAGRLVPPGDAAALATAIRELAGDAPLRARMGAAGRAVVSADFDVRREAQRLHHVLTERLQGRSPPVRPALPGEEES